MALTKVTEGVRTLGTGEVATANMATDPTNASNLSSGDVPLAQLGNAPETDVTGIQDDIALLAFKTQANGSLARYNLVDQSVDSFEDASGIDASASTNEIRNASNYYSGSQSGTATGGTETTYSTYRVHTFTSDGTFTPPMAGNVDVLVVAGGGGGTRAAAGGGGGGGGAGGFMYFSQLAVTGTGYAVTVGAGDSYNSGPTGDDSQFGSETAADGGGTYGNPGGSGGGGNYNQAGVAGTANQGNAGGSGDGAAGIQGGGGGGGASAVGGNGGTSSGGAGGNGYTEGSSTVYDWTLANGTTATFNINGTGNSYAGGGGGSGSGSQGAGGTGGGTAGRGSSSPANSGGGGGGGDESTTGGGGGSGIVVVRYSTDEFESFNNMTLISNSQTAEATPTKGDMVMTYTNGAGTNTLNTDIKGYVSRDNGTTYTQGTLASQGTTGGHTIVTFHDLDISSQPSGTAMRYKIETLNQSSAKETRIQAVSLGWS